MKKSPLIILMLLFTTCVTYGNDLETMYREVAQEFNLDPSYLKLIAILETGEKPFTINCDKKAYFFNTRKGAEEFLSMIPKRQSVDIGLMQIRSTWFKKIGIDRTEGLDPKYSLKIAAILLKDIFGRHGESYESLKWYHSSKKSFQDDYQRRIKRVVDTGNHRVY